MHRSYVLDCVAGRTTALVNLRHHQHGSLSRRSRDDGSNATEEAAPAEYLVRQHEEAVLTCEAVNGSGAAARWRHNGIEVDPTHRYSRDPRSGRLTISSVKLEDDGTWQCEDRETGVVARAIWLVVLGESLVVVLLTCSTSHTLIR